MKERFFEAWWIEQAGVVAPYVVTIQPVAPTGRRVVASMTFAAAHGDDPVAALAQLRAELMTLHMKLVERTGFQPRCAASNPPRKLLVLGGSSRFAGWREAWEETLVDAGHGVTVPDTEDAMRAALGVADGLVVFNAFAYLGEGTRAAIEDARRLGRTLYFLESWGEDCGVGPSHTEAYRADARRYGVPLAYRSPIRTADHPTPWSSDLLGHGPDRAARVVCLKERLRERLGGDAT